MFNLIWTDEQNPSSFAYLMEITYNYWYEDDSTKLISETITKSVIKSQLLRNFIQDDLLRGKVVASTKY